MIKYKRILTIVLVIGISAFIFFTLFTPAPKMGTLTLIKAGGEIIDCSRPFAGPTIYDFDNDGLQDLIIGMHKGNFRFYKNKGTSNVPVYDDFTLIRANGENALIKNW